MKRSGRNDPEETIRKIDGYLAWTALTKRASVTARHSLTVMSSVAGAIGSRGQHVAPRSSAIRRTCVDRVTGLYRRGSSLGSIFWFSCKECPPGNGYWNFLQPPDLQRPERQYRKDRNMRGRPADVRASR